MVNKNIIISIFIVFMLLFSSSIFISNNYDNENNNDAGVNYNVNNHSLNNYNFTTDNSQILNLKYNNNEFVNYINISGKPIKNYFINIMQLLNNGTVFYYNNYLFISTCGNMKMQFNKSFNFNDTIVNTRHISFIPIMQETIGFNFYNVYSYNYSGYFITNGNITDGNSIYITNGIHIANKQPLVIGFSLKPSFHKYINSVFKNNESKLVNNNDNIKGKYINFYYNNGIFSNINYINTSIFHELYVTGNGYMKTDYINNNSLLVHNSIIAYFNNTVYLTMHNNIEMESNIFINNGTLHLILNKNESFYNISFPGVSNSYKNYMMSFSDQNIGNNLSAMINMLNFNIIKGENAICINDKNLNITIFLNNLNYTYNSNEINISSNGMLSFIVNANNTYNKAINNGVSKGKISSEMIINYNNTTENTIMYYNSSVSMNINKINKTNIIINISSNDKSGTLILFYLSKNIINSNNFYIKFDNNYSEYTTMKNIMNATSTNVSYYTYLNDNSYTYILLYIPHFSNHTIDITDIKPLKNNINYYEIGVLSIAIMASIIAGILINKKKKEIKL